jgi:hypothetical protein
VAHIGVVAPMALQHRRRRSPDEPEAEKLWSLADEEKLQKTIEDWLG